MCDLRVRGCVHLHGIIIDWRDNTMVLAMSLHFFFFLRTMSFTLVTPISSGFMWAAGAEGLKKARVY